MSTTPNQHGFHFPDYTDSPDVPKDISLLAKDIADFIDANPGPAGPQGTAATIQVGNVEVLPAGSTPEVINTGTSSEAVFNFKIPRGVDGVLGGPGPATEISVNPTITGAPGTQASVVISGTAPSQTLTFTIPRGDKGDTGLKGDKGDTGEQGPAAATITVAPSTTTGAPGTNASVTNSGTSSAVVLNFTIPRGADGSPGAAGEIGPMGPPGADGASATLNPIDGVISMILPTSGVTSGVASNWFPQGDNQYSCGIPSGNGVTFPKRWSTIYSATSTISTSDARSKTNIEDSVLGLNFINSLRPVSFNFIEGGKDHEGNSIPGQRTHWGLLAQEVKDVVDDAGVDFGGWVLTDKNDPDSDQGLRYEELIAPLIKAVQELTARVRTLEGQ